VIWRLNILENKDPFLNYWYVACESKELQKESPLARTILGETIVLFRDENGQPVALQDRCPHRNFKLSKGAVKNGCLRCPYHGWTLNAQAEVINVPAEGPNQKKTNARHTKLYATLEKDDFIYVFLGEKPETAPRPFSMPKYKEPGFKTVRLFNVFKNNVLNCAENYVDVPHTVFVHNKIFRVSRQEKVEATVERRDGSVIIDYQKETDNFGWFSWFLNPSKKPIKHTDHFHSPNVTSVEYIFGPQREFYISSHCTPVSATETHVYTDLTFNFGAFNLIAAPFVRYQGQSVIDQDIEVLGTQMEVIKKYGTQFQNSKADIVHVYIESIRDEIAKGGAPRDLPAKKHNFEFWI
jgi:phenylpropionate dioxygenase-like ring-hydroxylating dioxygenase large terminal subunit